MSAELDQERAHLAEALADERDRLAEQHAAELARLAQERAEERTRADDAHTAELARSAERHTAELDRLTAQHADELAKLTGEHTEERERLEEERDRLARERIRLAGENARLTTRLREAEGARASALAATANAAGRMQALATGMLADLRAMEERHHDEEVLADLLHLDHRTAQAGRLADSVAVLTGARSGRRWARPIPMESILRGAMGRIAGYQRVRVHSASDTSVAGHAAEGVMHALAELLDNAANFSPPTAEVHVYVEEVAGRRHRVRRGQRPGHGRGRSCGAPSGPSPASPPSWAASPAPGSVSRSSAGWPGGTGCGCRTGPPRAAARAYWCCCRRTSSYRRTRRPCGRSRNRRRTGRPPAPSPRR